MFTESFPSSGCLRWLHNSGFQQTCHSILCYALDLYAKNKTIEIRLVVYVQLDVIRIDMEV
jgi:hypothetical protein